MEDSRSLVSDVVDEWIQDTLNSWEEALTSLEDGVFSDVELPALPGDVSYRQFMNELRARCRALDET